MASPIRVDEEPAPKVDCDHPHQHFQGASRGEVKTTNTFLAHDRVEHDYKSLNTDENAKTIAYLGKVDSVACEQTRNLGILTMSEPSGTSDSIVARVFQAGGIMLTRVWGL